MNISQFNQQCNHVGQPSSYRQYSPSGSVYYKQRMVDF